MRGGGWFFLVQSGCELHCRGEKFRSFFFGGGFFLFPPLKGGRLVLGGVLSLVLILRLSGNSSVSIPLQQ